MRWEFCTICLKDRRHLFGPLLENSPAAAVPPSASPPTAIIAPPKLAGDFEIDIGLVQAGIDVRTTCMIRNIPNKYTQVSPAHSTDGPLSPACPVASKC